MVKKRRIAGAAAGCAVVLATSLGTPSVSAYEVCKDPCGPGNPPIIVQPGPPEGPFLKVVDTFAKVEERVPESAFHKIESPFLKVVWEPVLDTSE